MLDFKSVILSKSEPPRILSRFPSGYIADPFVFRTGVVVAEHFNRFTRRGTLHLLQPSSLHSGHPQWSAILPGFHHLSFPGIYSLNCSTNEFCILPEMVYSGKGNQYLFYFNLRSFKPLATIKLDSPPLIDPILVSSSSDDSCNSFYVYGLHSDDNTNTFRYSFSSDYRLTGITELPFRVRFAGSIFPFDNNPYLIFPVQVLSGIYGFGIYFFSLILNKPVPTFFVHKEPVYPHFDGSVLSLPSSIERVLPFSHHLSYSNGVYAFDYAQGFF